MKIATWIATWNIERLKHKKQINTIISECESLGADILILTETDTSVKPDFKYFFQTELLQGITEPVIYNDTESRVSIFTNYEITFIHMSANFFQSIMAVKRISGIHKVDISPLCFGNTFVHGIVNPFVTL